MCRCLCQSIDTSDDWRSIQSMSENHATSHLSDSVTNYAVVFFRIYLVVQMIFFFFFKWDHMFSYNDLKRVTETWYVSNPNSWFLCFSQVSSVKTWFLQLDLTWGKSLKAMSPSRCVVHTLLSPLCVNVCNERVFVALVSPHILVSLCSCGISEVNPGSGVCGSVTAGESAPSCESPCTKLSRMMLKCNAGLRVKEKKKKNSLSSPQPDQKSGLCCCCHPVIDLCHWEKWTEDLKNVYGAKDNSHT